MKIFESIDRIISYLAGIPENHWTYEGAKAEAEARRIKIMYLDSIISKKYYFGFPERGVSSDKLKTILSDAENFQKQINERVLREIKEEQARIWQECTKEVRRELGLE